MFWEQRQGPFKSIEIAFETHTKEDLEKLIKKYNRVQFLTHTSLDVPSSMTLRHKKTPLIHVDGTAEEILKRCRDTVRNEIRRTQRLETFRITFHEQSPAEVIALYTDFERSQHRAPFPESYLQRFQCVLAWDSGTLLSGIYFFETNQVLRVFAIFSARMQARSEGETEEYKLIGYASKRLVYELCLFAKEHGNRVVDLAGINLVDADRASIARFKSGFGAEIGDEYRYTYVSPLFRFVVKLRAFWIRLRV